MKLAMMISGVLGLAAATASADEVTLNSGQKFVGIARQEDNRMVVETRLGTQAAPLSDVKSVVLGRTPIHEYAERLADLEPCHGAPDVFNLALWARDQGLIRYVHPLLERTLELDPDHAVARKLAGYVSENGCWILKSDRDAAEAAAKARAAAAHRRDSAARRSRPAPETVPYTLGIPRSQPSPKRGSYYGGGYSIWQGVVPTNNLTNMPVFIR